MVAVPVKDLPACVDAHVHTVDIERGFQILQLMGISRIGNQTGVYPINHTLVVRDELLAANPWLAEELFNMFNEAKETYLKRLKSGENLETQDHAMLEMAQVVGDDPIPYGFEAAVPTLETIIQFAVDQNVIPERVDPEAIFASGTLKL